MLSFIQFINESQFRRNEGVEYHRNPGKSRINLALGKSEFHTLRYYYDNATGDTYIWDASDSTHGNFAWSHGLDWSASKTGFIHPEEYEEIKSTSDNFRNWILKRHEEAKDNDWQGRYIPDTYENDDVDMPSNKHMRIATATKSKGFLNQAMQKIAAGDVKVHAHTRDGSQVHAYTRHRPSQVKEGKMNWDKGKFQDKKKRVMLDRDAENPSKHEFIFSRVTPDNREKARAASRYKDRRRKSAIAKVTLPKLSFYGNR